MSKVQGIDSFRKTVYDGLVSKGYSKSYENFLEKNGSEEKAHEVWSTLSANKLYDGDLDQFKEQFYGVKKKETPSKSSASGSESDYVGTAGVMSSGSTLERTLSGFNFVREGQELSAGKKEQTLATIRQMKQERPGSTIVQVNESGRPSLRYLEDHKEIVKKKAVRVPDAATLAQTKPTDAVLDFYANKPSYLEMVEERRTRGWDNPYNEGKFVVEGINEMQKDVKNALDIKAKEIGKPLIDQYLKLSKKMMDTDPADPEFRNLSANYRYLLYKNPDVQEYQSLLDKFWTLDQKQKEAKSDPKFKGYFDIQDRKEQAQLNADMLEMSGISGIDKSSVLPAATKEFFDLGAGLVRAAAGMERWLTGKKYNGLDATVEWMERTLDPALNSKTATPSNRTQLVGQRYADVGEFRVLVDESGRPASVVTRQGGYRVRDQKRVDAVIQDFNFNKPEIQSQTINPYTATDVIIGGAMQMGMGMAGAGLGAKLGKAGSILSNLGSKTTTVSINTASTYNKLYNAAITELGPTNQAAAERYASLASLGMSMLSTVINPLEQQLMGITNKAAIQTLAKELAEGVAPATAIRSAVKATMEFGRNMIKEGVVEGAAEAGVDAGVKYLVNKSMLKPGEEMQINLSQDVLDNVAEETLGGLFGSVAASLSPSRFQIESLNNAYSSPNRNKILAKLPKAAKLHYSEIFAKKDMNPELDLANLHREAIPKARIEATGEQEVKPPSKPAPEPETTPEVTATTPAIIASEVAKKLDVGVGSEVTTAMGQVGTVVGTDVDQNEDEDVAEYYRVQMKESGEEILVSIADLNKKYYEEGIAMLQSEGLDRAEAEFTLAAARTAKGLGSSVTTTTLDSEPIVTDEPTIEATPQDKKIDGIEYLRQEPLPGLTGTDGEIEFVAGRKMEKFKYRVVEADQVQPSHTNSGERNPMHFIPEAQPKERNDMAGMAASDSIANDIDFGRIAAAPNPYTGAPVVNSRGEVIQGNNRAIAIKKHYGAKKAKYRNELITKAKEFGIDPEQVKGMSNPVLVRELNVDDQTAIELGNYDVKDLETGGLRRIDPVQTSRRIPFEAKQKIAQALLQNEDESLRTNIRNNFVAMAKALVPEFISPTQYETMVSKKTGAITPNGIDDVSDLVLHFLFDGGDIQLRRVFDSLPYALQQGIIASMPKIFSVPASESLIEQIQNAMILIYETRASGSVDIDEYLGQSDMFDENRTTKFTATDIALAKLLFDKKQKEVQKVFSQYLDLVSGASDMFETRPGVSKGEALAEMTGVPYQPTPQDIINGAAAQIGSERNQDIQPEQGTEVGGSDQGGGRDGGVREEAVPTRPARDYPGGARYTDIKSVPSQYRGLYRVIEKALKAMANYGQFNVYYYQDQNDIRNAYNSTATLQLGANTPVNGFFNPDDNSIHVFVKADAVSTTALHEILHPFVRALMKADAGLFNKLYQELTTLPEYAAVTMSGTSVKGFAENDYYQFLGSVEEEALVEFFARVASGELMLRGKSKGKLIDWINSILRAVGFDEIGENADVRKWAAAIAQAINEGIALDRIEGEVVDSVEQDIELARKLLNDAEIMYEAAIQKAADKIQSALRQYKQIKFVFHKTNEDIARARQEITGEFKRIAGFALLSKGEIHVSFQSKNPTHTLMHEGMHFFVRAMDDNSFNKLFAELTDLPEYRQTLKNEGISVEQHQKLYPERSQKEEALVEYFAAVASGEIPVKVESKIIEILNRLLARLGFEKIVDVSNIRFIAEGLATAFREGIELERIRQSPAAQLATSSFPYYNRISTLIDTGVKRGIAEQRLVQTVVSAFAAEGVTLDPSLVQSIARARVATATKAGKNSTGVWGKVKELHQKYFVAADGGTIRNLIETLDGRIQRQVEQAQALITLAEKQSKGVSQDLINRFLRDENNLSEKQAIVDNLRALGFDEANIEQYLRSGTTRYQRQLMVEEFRQTLPATQFGTNAGIEIDQVFIDNTLESFVESTMSEADRGEVPIELAETLTTMRTMLDNLSQTLIDEGYAVGDRVDVLAANMGQYMSDVYGIFKDKKFKPDAAAKAKAKAFFAQQIKSDPDKLAALASAGGDLEVEIDKAAAREVEDYLVSKTKGRGIGQGAAVGKKSEAIFTQRQGVPDELKDLLGKYDPLQEFAYTTYLLANYVEKSRFQRDLAELGTGLFMWDKNDPARPVDANYELTGFASQKFGGMMNPLKGRMVARETYEVLEGLDKVLFDPGAVMSGVLKFQGWVNKFKTVYSYSTHFGNVLGNLFFLAFNGMLDYSTISSIGTALKGTGRDLFSKYGINQDEVEEVLTILKDESVIGQDISIQAIRQTVGDLEKSKPGGNPFQQFLGRSRDVLVTADEALTKLYQAEDSFFKILAYTTERKRYGQSLYGKSWSEMDRVQKEEVNRIATEIAKQNWPNYKRMGKFSQTVAKNNLIFGNFLPFTFEAVRTYSNTINLAMREMRSTNPGVRGIGRKRMAGIVAGSLAADAVLLSVAKGAGGLFALFFKSDDDNKLNRDLRIGVPKFLKSGDLMFTEVRPGVYNVVDLSAKNPLSVFRRHINAITYTPTDETLAISIAGQFMESFLGETIAMKFIDSMRSNDDGKGKEIWLSTDTGPERAEKIFLFALKTIGPASITSAQKVLNSETPGRTALNQMMGMNTYEIDFERVWGKKLQEYSSFEGVYNQLRAQLKKVANSDVTDREFEEAIDEFNEKRKRRLDALIEVKAAMLHVGLSDVQVRDVIDENLTKKEDKIYLKTGTFVEIRPNRQKLLYGN